MRAQTWFDRGRSCEEGGREKTKNMPKRVAQWSFLSRMYATINKAMRSPAWSSYGEQAVLKGMLRTWVVSQVAEVTFFPVERKRVDRRTQRRHRLGLGFRVNPWVNPCLSFLFLFFFSGGVIGGMVFPAPKP